LGIVLNQILLDVLRILLFCSFIDGTVDIYGGDKMWFIKFSMVLLSGNDSFRDEALPWEGFQ